MQAVINGISSTTTEHESTIESRSALGSLARTTGLMYAILFVLAMFGPMVIESLVEAGDGPATLQNLNDSLGLFAASIGAWFVIVAIDVALSFTLYRLLEPAGRTLSMIMAGFRLTYSAIIGAYVLKLVDVFTILNGAERVSSANADQLVLSAMDSFSNGFLVALVFFGIHLVLLGAALVRSAAVPRVIGFILAIAGTGYVVDSMLRFFTVGHSDTATIVLLTPAIIGEAGLALWLLLKGVRRVESRNSEMG